MSQVLSEPTRKDALPDLLFVNTEGLMVAVLAAVIMKLSYLILHPSRIRPLTLWMKGRWWV